MKTKADRFDLVTYLKREREVIDRTLAAYIDLQVDSSRLYHAMSYSVMAGGKRLRPILCVATAQAVNSDRQSVLPVACALELIHTYSLIHDDLPAMDDDTWRRGTLTCHVQFDEATAVLAGDALLTLAFEILASKAHDLDATSQRVWLRVMADLAVAAGRQGMIEGQMRDMAAEGSSVTIKDLKALHRLKTGRMIEVSVASGATVAGASDNQKKALNRYAAHIGLAFQVVDDILNVKGDPRLMGKAVGTDQRRLKNTFPSLLGLDGAQRMAAGLVNEALMALADFDKKAEPLRAIATYVLDRDR